MRRWLVSMGAAVVALVVVFAVWQLIVRPEPNDDASSPETTVEEDGESIPAPTEEEIEVLVTQLESRDMDVFLRAWVSDLEELLEEEVIREEFMVPEGSMITPSDLSWSDDNNGWTTEMMIEAPDHEPIIRTMVLEHFEGQWRISREMV